MSHLRKERTRPGLACQAPQPSLPGYTQGLHLAGPKVTLSLSSVPPKINTESDSRASPNRSWQLQLSLAQGCSQGHPPVCSAEFTSLATLPHPPPSQPALKSVPDWALCWSSTHSISFNPQELSAFTAGKQRIKRGQRS